MPDWSQLIDDAAQAASAPVRAETFVKRFGTASNPVLLSCDDGHDYVVKAVSAGRMIITDQVLGRIGHGADAPVPAIRLVLVPAELIAAEHEMQHMTEGVAHGSRWIPDCSHQTGFEHTTVPENRDRFARIALFYGWVVADDRQFIYENRAPHLVHSVDHGHFLPGSTGWTEASLSAAPAPTPDAQVVASCHLADTELETAKAGMVRVDNEEIAAAVAAARDEWAISAAERIAAAGFLATRRDVFWTLPTPESEDADDGEPQ